MNDFVITATRSMHNYASRVTDYLTRIPRFSPMAETINAVDILVTDRFASGEMEVAIKQSVRGKDVILFSSCSYNDAGIGLDEAKIELYHTVDALKRSQVEDIIVFEPYISCSRSDRTTRRNSVGLWMHFKILASLGVRHVITYQLHSNKSVSMLDPSVCTMDDIPALNLLKRYLCDTYIRDLKTLEEEVRPNWAFCSVDAGGEKLAREFANSFGSPLVIAHKQRDYFRVNTIESISILSAEPVEGKVLWIVDDEVDTASSVESLIRALSAQKPKEINIIAVHALFSPPASQRLNKLMEEGLLKKIIVTDTVSPPALSEIHSRIEVVPSAELSAEIIRIIMLKESMGKLMDPFNAEQYFKSPTLFNFL
ncbi:MAG: ribose-phosphate diphosphokinase [Treponema sp.]|nr:ribose-phosphate diphosphokinase [Treponema sp.]